MSDKSVYRIIFHNQNKIYELYAKRVNQGSMLGFVEVGDLIFGEKSELVVDPSEEKLKTEFSGVKRIYVPLPGCIRLFG